MDFLKQRGFISSPGDPAVRVLDLACGSGEASQALERWSSMNQGTGQGLCIDAADPFTQAAYHAQTGRQAKNYSFMDIANGVLLSAANYDLVMCSFALHLCPSSLLYGTASQLALVSQYLLILAPHKKPHLTASMGWELVYASVADMRVHVRLYSSTLFRGDQGVT
jgi:SAM-dependent methyltransferase